MDRVDVVIIGAGAAGIGAARSIHEYNASIDPSHTTNTQSKIKLDSNNDKYIPFLSAEVVEPLTYLVLEASEKYGGRVREELMYCDRDDDSRSEVDDNYRRNYVSIQLGANWIHGLDEHKNPMCKIARELGLTLHETSSDDAPGDDVLLYDRNKEISMSEVVTKIDYDQVIERYEWMKDRIQHYNDDISLKEALDRALEESLQIYGNISELQRRCFNWFYDRIAISIATSLSNQSLQDFNSSESDGADSEAIVVGGYYQLIKYLYEQYPIPVKINHVVNTIDLSYSSDYMRIACSNGYEVLTKRCIVTVPVGVVKAGAIQYSPTIPKVIEHIGSCYSSGLMNLIWIWFPYQFWKDGFNFLGATRSDDEVTYLSTYLAPIVYDRLGNRQALLMCQVVHKLALDIEIMSDENVMELVLASLNEIFAGSGVTVPQPIACRHSSWMSNPFIRGSWAYKDCKVYKDDFGIQETNVSSLSEHGVMYAGETAAAKYKGTVHGAYISGMESALCVLKSLQNQSNKK